MWCPDVGELVPCGVLMWVSLVCNMHLPCWFAFSCQREVGVLLTLSSCAPVLSLVEVVCLIDTCCLGFATVCVLAIRAMSMHAFQVAVVAVHSECAGQWKASRRPHHCSLASRGRWCLKVAVNELNLVNNIDVKAAADSCHAVECQ